MPRQQRIEEFQKSITRELTQIKDRVEFIIGNANWGSVGSYKEAILRKSILQFLPSNLKIGTGFIVSNSDHLNGRNGIISTQLDIIIYDDKSPVIFQEGDFVIVTETSVRAVIEVKTKITNFSNPNPNPNNGRINVQQNALNIILHKLNKLRDFDTFNPNGLHRKKFIGVFSFDYSQNFSDTRVDDALKISNGLVNHISLGPDRFIRYWENTLNLDPSPNYNGRCYIRYDLRELSFSYFISNLIHITADEDPVERYWFSFPIEGTKERYRAINNPIIQLD